MTISDIEKRLRKMGFKKFKKESSKTISILVEGNRIDVLERVEKDLFEYGLIEQKPAFEGRQIVMVIAPKK